MSLYWLYLDDPCQQVQQPMPTLINSPAAVANPKLMYSNSALVNKLACPMTTLTPYNLSMDLQLNGLNYLTGVSKPDTSKHFHIFVGDLCPNLQTYHLYEAFIQFGQISECKIIQDPLTFKSKGYGFVTFVKKDDAENAIKQMNGQCLGSRTIRTNWAVRKNSAQTEGNTSSPPTLNYDDVFNQTHANNCNVYCGGIMTGLTEELITTTFLEFGKIQDVRLFKDKGYAFIRFFNKEDASRAIVGKHLSEINGHIVKCSWGKKSDDTSPGCSSTSPVPVPPFAQMHSSPSPVSMMPAVTKITHQQTVPTYLNLSSLPSYSNQTESNPFGFYIYPQCVYPKLPEEPSLLCQQPYTSLPFQLTGLRTVVPSQTNLSFPTPQTANIMYTI